MRNFLETLKSYDDFVCLNGAEDEAIKEAEEALNLHFAPEYKAYLKEFGAASADGHEFTGLVDSERLNVVKVTLHARSQCLSVPQDFYVVEEIQIDKIRIWQSADGSVYETVDGSSPEKTYGSLAEYIAEL